MEKAVELLDRSVHIKSLKILLVAHGNTQVRAYVSVTRSYNMQVVLGTVLFVISKGMVVSHQFLLELIMFPEMWFGCLGVFPEIS